MRSQLRYLGLAVDHLEAPGQHHHEGLVLLPVLAPPPARGQRRVLASLQLRPVTLPPLAASLGPGLLRPPVRAAGHGQRGAGHRPRALASARRRARLPCQLVLGDVGEGEAGQEAAAERGGAGQRGQQRSVRGLELGPGGGGHDGVGLGVVAVAAELGPAADGEAGQGEQHEQHAGRRAHHHVHRAHTRLEAVDHRVLRQVVLLKAGEVDITSSHNTTEQ